MSSDILGQYLNGVRSVAKHIYSKSSGESFQGSSYNNQQLLEQQQLNNPSPLITVNTALSPSEETFITVFVIVFVLWNIMFSIGGAVQSYIYNKSIGTSNLLTGIYMILCFIFPFFYYPVYTLFLGGGASKSANRPVANSIQVAGRRK